MLPNQRLELIGNNGKALDNILYGHGRGAASANYEKDGQRVYAKSFAEWQQAVAPHSAKDHVGEIRFRNGPALEAHAATCACCGNLA